MADVDLSIGGRQYRVACRAGEEQSLLAAAQLVDQKAGDVAAGLGSLSEPRQLLFASLLLADQLLSAPKRPAETAPAETAPAATDPMAPLPPDPIAAPVAPALDPALVERAARLVDLLEAIADGLDHAPARPVPEGRDTAEPFS